MNIPNADLLLAFSTITMILAIVTVILLIITYIALRTVQHYVKDATKTLAIIKYNQEQNNGLVNAKSELIVSNQHRFFSNQKQYNRNMDNYTKSLERIEQKISEVKDCQTTYLNRNDNAANGNKVKVVTDTNNKSQEYQTALFNQLLSQIVDRLQDGPAKKGKD